MFSTGSFFSLTVKYTRIRDEVIYKGAKDAKICWKLINTEINMVYVPRVRWPSKNGMSVFS